MSEISEEIRYVMLYYYRKGKTAAKTCRKLCAVYGENVVSERGTQNWFARFRSGNFDVKDAPRSGRPITNKADEILQLVKQDRHASCQKIADALNINHMTVWNHLKKAGYAKTLDFWVAPASYNNDQDATTKNRNGLKNFDETAKEVTTKSRCTSRRGKKTDTNDIVLPRKKIKQTKASSYVIKEDDEYMRSVLELEEQTQPTANVANKITNGCQAQQKYYTETENTTPQSRLKSINDENCLS